MLSITNFSGATQDKKKNAIKSRLKSIGLIFYV